MSAPLSDKEYQKAGGGKCPCCGSEDIEGDSIDVQGRNAYQKVSCHECQADWEDVYQLVGYTELKDAEGELIPHEENTIKD